ncbi:MAG: adenosine kinase [Nanoarchaeota archaeon]|nr:adenosine kinase [Nanoarchaeota archaeon]
MKKFDVIGLGNSLLDFSFEIEDKALESLGFKKGEMTLVDKEKSKDIFLKLGSYESKISPGGSCSNTIAGIAILGGKTAFFGKIGFDEYGKLYEDLTNEIGIDSFFSNLNNEMTGHAITFITPDKERSFAVNLGASMYFNKKDIIEEVIKNSKILHLEGYSFEALNLKEASLYAIDIAKKNNVKVSIDLSDPGIIKRNHEFFRELLEDSIDIVFVNEKEAEEFTKKSPEEAIKELSKLCEIAIVKLGENGSIIRFKGKTYKIPSFKTNLMNTNGAGDMYAAGFLYGLSKNLDLEKSGKLASYAASLVVASPGARLEKDLIISLNKYKSEIGA